MPDANNMPIVWQNALEQFSTEIGKKAWVWFAETRDTGMCYAADRYALEVEKLVLATRPMLEFKRSLDTETVDDLLRFILVRHANWRLGGNVQPAFLQCA